jgi:hypothetical protein
MAITKLTTRWDFTPGGPGYSNFYVTGALTGTPLNDFAAAVSTLLTAAKAMISTAVTITFIPTVTVLDEITGTLVNPDTIGTVPTNIAGSSSGAYAAGVGWCITWRTIVLSNRRLTTGRTFLVPAGATGLSSDGTPADTTRATVQTAANTYISRVPSLTPGHPVVWHRNTPGSANGFAAPVTSATISDRVAYLRSRRT